MNRPDAFALVCEYTQSDSLRKHMLAVEAAMGIRSQVWSGRRWRFADLCGLDSALNYLQPLNHTFDWAT
ncbi:MAG: hypothetical protein K8T91_11065 [Planctomycetes bacterium]|nr:hypothetical protein [Planctomycetota bacterium]